MGVKLDMRGAVGNANADFREFPMYFCAPLVLCGVATSVGELIAHWYLSKGTAIWVGLIVIVSWVPPTFLAELLVSSMYVASRNGAAPDLAQLKQVARYEGLWRVLWGLLLRYVGWAIVGVMSLTVVGFIGLIGKALLHIVTAKTSGIGGAAGGMSATVVWVAGFELVFAVILSRYLFVVPMTAILEGNTGLNIIRDSVRRTKLVRRTVAVLAVAEIAPGVAAYLCERAMWPGADAYHGVRAVAGIVVTVLNGCYLGWFVLLRTDLAKQLLIEVPLTVRSQGEAPWV